MDGDSADVSLQPSIGGRAIRQTTVTLGGQLVHTALHFVSLVVLARLLTPSHFGLIAMTTSIVAFVGLLRDLGLTQAVVQTPDLRREQLDSLFWFNTAATTVLALVTLLGAPLLAAFYGEPILAPITRAFAGVLFVGGLAAVHQGLLQRKLELHKIVGVELAAHLVAVAAAIAAASIGFGVWSLVILSGLRTVLTTVGLWSVAGWLPRPTFSRGGTRSLIRFGLNVTGFNVANYLARHLDDVLIGRTWGATPLGLYSRAYSLLTLPLSQVNAPLMKVAVPVLSRLQNEPVRYRIAYLRQVRPLVSITTPAIVFGLATSDWLVALALGPGWEGVVPIFRWLGVAALMQPLASSTGWLFITQDRTGSFFRWGITSSTIIITAFVLGLPFGAVGVAAAYTMADVLVRTPLLFLWVGRRGPVSTGDLWSVLPFPLMIGMSTLASSLGVRYLLTDPAPVIGLVTTAAAALIAGVVAVASTRSGRAMLREARTVLDALKAR